MIVFGGTVENSLGSESDANDLWQLSLVAGSERWKKISPQGTPPPAMLYPVGVVTAETPAKLYLMGTFDRSSLPGAFIDSWWVLSLAPGAETWTRLQDLMVRPSTRITGALGYDPVLHRAILSGGVDPFITRNDIWALTLP
jgi:hypothetical protein